MLFFFFGAQDIELIVSYATSLSGLIQDEYGSQPGNRLFYLGGS